MVNELRIGNCIYPDYVVTGIDSLKGVVYVARNGEKGGQSIESTKPIPLSPEILEKCGFRKITVTTEGGEWGTSVIAYYTRELRNMSEFRIRVQDLGEDGIHYVLETGFRGYVTSLHHLQNVYYFGTGEELEVNLTFV
jgi:hypothetical protein